MPHSPGDYAREWEEYVHDLRQRELHARDLHREALPEVAALADRMCGFRDGMALHAAHLHAPREGESLSDGLRRSILEELPALREWLDTIEKVMRSGDD